MKKKKKGLLAIAMGLVMVMAMSVTVAFAWWDSRVAKDSVELEVGNAVTISLDVGDYTDGKLVPATAILKPGDVTEVVVPVAATMSEVIIEADLTIDHLLRFKTGDADGTVLGALKNEDDGPLFNVAVLTSSTIDGTYTTYDSATQTITNAVYVKFVITFNGEPKDQTTYDAVANAILVLDVTFTVGA